MTDKVHFEIPARAMFNAFDSSGRGYIPAKDLKNAIIFILDSLTEEEKNNVIQFYKYVYVGLLCNDELIIYVSYKVI